MNYGIQLYGLRDIAKESLETALRGVSELGYASVEFAGFFGHSAETVKSWLAKYKLYAIATHTGWTELVEHFDETAAYHKAIGCDLIIIPGADLATKEKLYNFIESANTLVPKLKAEGIRLAYHNHAFEFWPNEDGQIIYDELVNRSSLSLQLDTFWAYAAGKDPLYLMETLQNRLVGIHIKDGLSDHSGKPLGMGTAPVVEVCKAACRLKIPMVVESETQQPDGLSEARICMEYLRGLESAEG